MGHHSAFWRSGAFAAALVLGSVGFAAGCNKGASDPNTSAYWIERLEDPSQRIDALKHLGKLGDPKAAPAVVSVLSQNGPWQPDAAYTLGQLGDASVAPSLVAVLDYTAVESAAPALRHKVRTNINAVRAIAMLHATTATENLLQLLKSRSPSTREAVMLALGELKDVRATEALMQIAATESQPFLRKISIQALGQIGDAKATDVLIANLFVELPGVSFYNEARHSLTQLGSATVPRLLETLQRKNTNVEAIRTADGSPVAEGAIEAKAASVLGELKVKEAEGPIATALGALYRRYKKSSAQDPVFASVPAGIVEMSYALARLGASPKSAHVLCDVAKDEDARLREAAAEALAGMGDVPGAACRRG